MPLTLEELTEQLHQSDWEAFAFFLKKGGSITLVDALLDFNTVALAVANNDVEHVSHWIQEGLLTNPSPDDAARWSEDAEQQFRFVILRPHVLAQLIPKITPKPHARA